MRGHHHGIWWWGPWWQSRQWSMRWWGKQRSWYVEDKLMQVTGMLPGDATKRIMMAAEVMEDKGQGRQRSRCVDDTMTRIQGMWQQRKMKTWGHNCNNNDHNSNQVQSQQVQVQKIMTINQKIKYKINHSRRNKANEGVRGIREFLDKSSGESCVSAGNGRGRWWGRWQGGQWRNCRHKLGIGFKHSGGNDCNSQYDGKDGSVDMNVNEYIEASEQILRIHNSSVITSTSTATATLWTPFWWWVCQWCVYYNSFQMILGHFLTKDEYFLAMFHLFVNA